MVSQLEAPFSRARSMVRCRWFGSFSLREVAWVFALLRQELVGFPFCCDLGSKAFRRVFLGLFCDEVHSGEYSWGCSVMRSIQESILGAVL